MPFYFVAADLTIDGNSLVSSKHCVLMKGAEERGVVIKDTSTNGTLLNGKKMVKGEEVSVHVDAHAFINE